MVTSGGLVAVHAHPDDESLSMAGTLATAALGGAEVVLVTATLGEEGEVIGDELQGLVAARADQLGGYRLTELRTACAALGAGDAFGYVGYFAELLDEWAQDADADERLYRLGASMLDALGAGAPLEPLARYFEYWLLRLQGVYPEAHGSLSAGAITFLALSRRLPPHRLGELTPDPPVIDELRNTHRALIAMHLEKTLKSERVLRDLRRHA